jgi:homoserine kinase
MALDLRCSVTAVRSEEWAVRHVGPEIPEGADAVLAAAMAATDEPLSLTVRNDIPIGRGLGSSAAATAAGAAAAMLAVGSAVTRARIFEIVTNAEGHPDNAAATVFGGLVSVTTGGEVVSLDLSSDIEVVIAVPDQKLSTELARRVLPDRIDRGVAVRTLQRLAVLIEGLRTGDARILESAGGDELHEAPRAHLNSYAEPLMTAARAAGALHVCWSGAGPSILALTDSATRESVATAMGSALGGMGVVSRPRVDLQGLVL